MTRVLPVRDLPNGWTVVTAKWDTVPDYPYAATAAGMDENQRRQELDLDWTASSGKLVYPEFGPVHQAKEPLPYDPKLPLILGWDFGGSPWTGTPACIISQISSFGQWLLYPPEVVEDGKSVDIYEFASEWVARRLYEEYAEPYGLELEDLTLFHFGDPAGNNKPPKTMATSRNAEHRSCYDIIQNGGEPVYKGEDEYGEEVYEERPGLGWMIQSGEVTVTRRLAIVKARLKLLLGGGHPALLIDPEATYLLDAFGGGYHYAQRKDGRYEHDPEKNWYSHGMNALEYAASRLAWTAPNRNEEDFDPHGLMRHGATSGAGRHRRPY